MDPEIRDIILEVLDGLETTLQATDQAASVAERLITAIELGEPVPVAFLAKAKAECQQVRSMMAPRQHVVETFRRQVGAPSRQH